MTQTETPQATTRRLLVWLGAGLLAGGMPVHELEEDIKEAAATVGHPDAEVAASPTGLFLTLTSGDPATFEAVDGGVRLDQFAEVAGLHAGLVVGTLFVGIGIALLLAPSWSSVIFAA